MSTNPGVTMWCVYGCSWRDDVCRVCGCYRGGIVVMDVFWRILFLHLPGEDWVWYVCDVLYVCVCCFVVRECAVSRRYIDVCYCDMFSVINVYHDHLKWSYHLFHLGFDNLLSSITFDFVPGYISFQCFSSTSLLTFTTAYLYCRHAPLIGRSTTFLFPYTRAFHLSFH